MRLIPSSSRWPLYLAIAGLIIVAASVWYTNRLANQLAVIENNYVTVYELTMNSVLQGELEETTGEGDTEVSGTSKDYTVEGYILQNNTTVPAILVDDFGEVVDAINFGDRGVDSAYINSQLAELMESGRPPISVLGGGYMYFGSSTLISKLRWFPFIQLGLIGTFVFLGILGIIEARKAEQNRVWVGMAKETAHQLGTPISAILGWLEHLKLMYADDGELMEVSAEMGKDVERLTMVANRFSKIGAEPELDPVNIYAELDKCRAYMEKRAPRKVSFDFPAPDAGDLTVAVNPLLFDWVIENLLRNALDAMDGKGQISGRVREAEGKVIIDISDTGKGISSRNIRKVFNPGFTTKQRGWGLGLSLVKRIIQQYHKGRIAVTASELGKGTTFSITLPKA